MVMTARVRAFVLSSSSRLALITRTLHKGVHVAIQSWFSSACSTCFLDTHLAPEFPESSRVLCLRSVLIREKGFSLPEIAARMMDYNDSVLFFLQALKILTIFVPRIWNVASVWIPHAWSVIRDAAIWIQSSRPVTSKSDSSNWQRFTTRHPLN